MVGLRLLHHQFIIQMLLRILHDMHHHAQRFHRILTLSRLTRKHYGIRPVIDRIRHIRHLGPGRTGIAHHGIQHLGCSDNRLVILITLLDNQLLQIRNLLCRNLHAQISPGNHDSIRTADNLINVLNPFRILNLCDNRDIRRLTFFEESPDFKDALRIAHKRRSDKINLLLRAKTDVLPVLLRNRREPHWDIGYIHPFPLAKLASIHDGTDNLLAILRLYFQPNQPVVNQNSASDLDIVHKTFICNGYLPCISCQFFRRQDKGVPFLQRDLLPVL